MTCHGIKKTLARCYYYAVFSFFEEEIRPLPHPLLPKNKNRPRHTTHAPQLTGVNIGKCFENSIKIHFT